MVLVVTKPRLANYGSCKRGCHIGQVHWCVFCSAGRRACGVLRVPSRSDTSGLIYVQRRFRFNVVHNEKRELVRAHTSHTRCCCAYCGALCDHEAGTCVDAMQ